MYFFFLPYPGWSGYNALSFRCLLCVMRRGGDVDLVGSFSFIVGSFDAVVPIGL